MEQAPYWMWAKRKQCLSSSGDSWEEQAFAEDSSGRLGGCIWPPRSYSCSFCRREFRSAQALGGHMNVHRRDRARLKQSPTEILHHDQINIPPCASLGGISGAQYPPTKASPSVYNSNTSTSNPATVVASSPPSPSRVSATSNNTQGNHSTEQTLIFPSYSSSSSIILQQHHHHRKGSLFSPPSGVFSVMDSEEINTPRNFNFVVHRSQPDGSGANHGGDKDHQEEEMAFIRKRQRSDDGSSLPFFVFNSSSVDRHLLQKEVLGLGKNSMEDIDLELRLGDGPKVK